MINHEDDDMIHFDRENLGNGLLQDYIENDLNQGNGILAKLPKFKLIAPALILLTVLGAGTYGIVQYSFGDSEPNVAQVPIVSADNSPIRQKPKDPGGMIVANQDKMVYGHISGATRAEEELPSVTHILSQTEEPIDRKKLGKNPDPAIINNAELPAKEEVIVAEFSPGTGVATSHMNVAAAERALKKEEAKIAAQENQMPKNIAAQIARQAPAEIQGPIVKEKMEQASLMIGEQAIPNDEPVAEVKIIPSDVTPPASAAPAANSQKMSIDDIKKSPLPIRRSRVLTLPEPSAQDAAYQIQLGSFRNQQEVHKNWEILQHKHSDLLGGLTYSSEKADLGSKGVFYRLKVGSFKNEEAAREVCNTLSERKQGCFFVR